jgi:hypothetical protein
MPTLLEHGIYFPPWIFLFVVFAGISAYLFVLTSKLDPDDPTNKVNNTWVKVNWVVASVIALFAIVSIPWGIFRQKKLMGLKAAKAAVVAATPQPQMMAMPMMMAAPAPAQ